jgi:hypothetical protein
MQKKLMDISDQELIESLKSEERRDVAFNDLVQLNIRKDYTGISGRLF